jgi:lipoate-protein ligase A
MIYIETDSTDPAFHFSVEEYLVRDYPLNEPVLMTWQADKCAMLGCNQAAQAEVDLGFAAREGICIVRRLSGGGTIYTDLGTLLYTVIQPYSGDMDPLDIAKEQVAAPVVRALGNMGVPAVVEGRNDILVDGRKVSGFAQYVRHGRLCTHGSLLYDADLDMLGRVLRVDDGKYRTKASRSVRSRVTNIREHMKPPVTTMEFRELLKRELFSGFGKGLHEYELSQHDLAQIDGIAKARFGDQSWTFLQSPRFSVSGSRRYAGGKVDVYLDVVKGAVSSCTIRGDFLGVAPIRGLEEVFEEQLFQYHAIAGALEGVAIERYLGDITVDELLSCVFE